MSATVLPAATAMTDAAVTEGQFKNALTSFHDFVSELQTKAADVASASTTNIGAAAGNYVRVTGTTTITAFDNPTAAPNVTRIVQFTGALTLTYNATSLILPGLGNITTVAGDIAKFVHEGSGNWRCAWYTRAGGAVLPLSQAGAANVGVATDSAACINMANNAWVQWNSGATGVYAASSDGRLAFRTGSTESGSISSTGNLTIAGSTATKASGTTWANPSDRRLKDNIRDYDKGLAELLQIRVREWDYNGKGGTSAGLAGLGVIADEVMEVLPNTVTEYAAKLNPDDAEDTAIKKFDASEVIWLLVKSCQQLAAEVAALKGE